MIFIGLYKIMCVLHSIIKVYHRIIGLLCRLNGVLHRFIAVLYGENRILTQNYSSFTLVLEFF